MLNFVLREWNNYDYVIFKGFNKYQEILDNDEDDIKKDKMSSNSKFHLYNNIINIASLYKDSEFYLPVFIDFRGRVYPLSSYLNYQGGDLARSLILFGQEYEEILDNTGVECLNIYLANLAGYDKVSWNRRLKLVDEIIGEFLISNKISPVKYLLDHATDISEPFQFMSIIFSKLLHLKNPKTKISNPILFDASCSGIQHIASLTLEKELAKNVNVFSDSSSPKDEIPKDFYIYAVDIINEKIKESPIDNLSKIILTRKIIKRSVITIPYNITLTGMGDQIMKHFKIVTSLKDKLICVPAENSATGKEIFLTYKEYGELIKIIYMGLTQELPSLKMLSDYFNGMIKIFVKLNMPIT